jgi:hypothetical protein
LAGRTRNLSLATPFAVYLIGEERHVSGCWPDFPAPLRHHCLRQLVAPTRADSDED